MTNPQEPTPGRTEPTTPPSGPAPQDPREREPIHDPPVDPDHDGVSIKADRSSEGKTGIPVPKPAPDAIVRDRH